MSKKRDALRRGIRDLIQDTSRDLVAFEGREPGPHAPPPAAHTDAPSLNGGPVGTADPSAHDHPGGDVPPAAQTGAPDTASREAAPTSAEAGLPAEPQPAAAKLDPAPFELSSGTAFLPPIDPPSEASSTRRSASHPAPPQDAPLSPAPQAQKRPEVLRHTGKKAKPDRRAGHREATGGPAPDRAGGAKERAPAEPRRPATPSADDLEGDDAGPDQVESRTGVCRSYFVNHDCWRVPGAYCNTALQVCVIRNCPVYHLHKDALERRFAKKFKHFW